MNEPASEDQDAQLMLAVRAGERGAFDRLIERNAGLLWQFFERQVGDAAEAEDLTQEVFLRVYRARERYVVSARFRAWLLSIAANLLLQRRRRRSRVRWESLEEPGVARALDAKSRAAGAPEDGLEREERDAAVRRAVAALPPSQRMAVDLLRFGGLAYAEIATAMGLELPAVKGLLYRAKLRLCEQLRPYLNTGRLAERRGRALPDDAAPERAAETKHER